jgi:uncharacterized protein YeaO (DUF488 family)
MRIIVKRIYDLKKPADRTVFLVDRLWPRGVHKELLGKGTWLKEVAPSNDLRAWFHENKEKRFFEFKRKYYKELELNKEFIKEVFGKSKKVTLLTAAKDVEYSHLSVLVEFLSNLK